VKRRAATPNDLPFLEQMLFEAFFWDTAVQRPPFEVFRAIPEASKLLAGWGRRGDYGVIAEEGEIPLGAAWFRLWSADDHSYGFVSPLIPELAIAVSPSARSKGIGRSLLIDLIDIARNEGFPGLSLSVSPSNRARELYERAGFRKAGESGTSWTYLLTLAKT
jgi:GNAT superfamily N-acetyltransferase